MNSDHLSTIITSMIMVENDKLVDHVDDYYIFVQAVHSVYKVFLLYSRFCRNLLGSHKLSLSGG